MFKNWNVFILLQFPNYDLRFPLPPFLISAAHWNSIWEIIYYYGVGKRPMTKRLTKGWQNKFHPADSFPAFSPVMSSTIYQHSDWPTLEILFSTIHVPELVFLKTVNFSLSAFLWIQLWIFLIAESCTPTDCVFSLFSTVHVESWSNTAAEGSPKCVALVYYYGQVFEVNALGCKQHNRNKKMRRLDMGI